MASIKDLQNNQEETIIDATQPPQKTVSSGNTSTKKTTINMNGMFEQPKGNHTSITPKGKSQIRAQKAADNTISIDATNNRKPIDLSQFPSKTEEEASLYATITFRGTGTSSSASFNNVGLWSYYSSRGNWNRE